MAQEQTPEYAGAVEVRAYRTDPLAQDRERENLSRRR
jgi:hypothetical protein